MLRGTSSYHDQIEAARNIGLAMTREQARAFLRLLEVYAEELATRVSAAFVSRGDRYALEVAREMIRQLSRDMAVSARSGITLTASRVTEIYATATVALLEASGASLPFGTFQGIGVQAAQAILSRPELSSAFRTIRRESVDAVDEILQRAILRGATGPQLGRELRLHVLGADVFPDRLLLDRRRIGYAAIREMGYEPTPENLRAVRKHASQISGKAQLIARTEPMNAQHEARIRAAIDSPVVTALRWGLSGRHPKKDVCDLLADQDWYGLGPGIYDPRRVPPRPHPRCLCKTTDVLVEDIFELSQSRGPLPNRGLEVGRIIDIHELPPSQERMLEAVLGIGERRYGRRAAA